MVVAVGFMTTMIALAVARLTRGITFHGAHTDNAKQVFTAAQAQRWRWPSEMHTYVEGGVRTVMKDVAVLGLVVMQRLLRDRTGHYPLVMLCMIAHALSSLLAFLIARAYWNTAVGVLVWGLMVSCLWSYQVSLFGKPIVVAQLFCLASVSLLQSAELMPGGAGLLTYALAGVAAGCMLFASAASRKYLPLVLGAFLYSQRHAWQNIHTMAAPGLPAGVVSAFIALSVLLLCGGLGIRLGYRQIVTAIYENRAPRWLSRFMRGRQRSSLDAYLARARELAATMLRLCCIAALGLMGTAALVRSVSFIWSVLLVAIGMGFVVVGLTAPNILSNLWAYYERYSQGWKHNRFGIYRAYFEKIGKPVPEGMRGAGWRWIVRYFRRIMPFHAVLYGACAALLVPILAAQGFSWPVLWSAAAVVVLSLSPILIGELTHGPQMSRSYYPALLGLPVLIGAVAWELDHGLAPPWRMIFWGVTTGWLVIGAGWTLWMFLTDVWPAYMAPAWLARTLERLGATEFATYDTPYNDALIGALPHEVRQRYAIRFIGSLQDATHGYVVVPGTSAKAQNMESSAWAMEHGDFMLDKELNRLLESRAIARYAVASFKTFGTSRIWVHESEVATYRDLILGEIMECDRWRGWAWVLDAGKLHAERSRIAVPAEAVAGVSGGVG